MKLKDVLKEAFGEEIDFHYFHDSAEKYLSSQTRDIFRNFVKQAASELKQLRNSPEANKLEIKKLLDYLKSKWSVF